MMAVAKNMAEMTSENAAAKSLLLLSSRLNMVSPPFRVCGRSGDQTGGAGRYDGSGHTQCGNAKGEGCGEGFAVSEFDDRHGVNSLMFFCLPDYPADRTDIAGGVPNSKNGRNPGFFDHSILNHLFINPQCWEISPTFGNHGFRWRYWPSRAIAQSLHGA